MTDKYEFIYLYLDDYVRMAYRELVNEINHEKEQQLISNLTSLLDRYVEGELQDYIHYNKIV